PRSLTGNASTIVSEFCPFPLARRRAARFRHASLAKRCCDGPSKGIPQPQAHCRVDSVNFRPPHLGAADVPAPPKKETRTGKRGAGERCSRDECGSDFHGEKW